METNHAVHREHSLSCSLQLVTNKKVFNRGNKKIF